MGGGGSGTSGAAGRPSVLPAPITEPVMPARTRLQEAGAEVAVYYAQIEGQVRGFSFFFFAASAGMGCGG